MYYSIESVVLALSLILCIDGAAAAQGGGGLPLLEGGQPAQLEALALPGADERAASSSRGLRQVRENNIHYTSADSYRGKKNQLLKFTSDSEHAPQIPVQ
jgi:hypothetical protein